MKHTFHITTLFLACALLFTACLSDDEDYKIPTDDAFAAAEYYFSQEKYDKALPLFTQAANAGKERAFYRLGEMYQNGFGVKADIFKAIEWYEKGAAKKETGCMWALASIYFLGNDDPLVEIDEIKGLYWLNQACDAGDGYALTELADMYMDGETFVKKDEQKALKLYEKAVEAGNGYAAASLGGYYYDKGDYATALKYYKIAAQKGIAYAINILGDMYYNGEGVTKDVDKAIELYQEAAGKNYPFAMVNLGYLYQTGEGFEQDYQEALFWYMKAAELDNGLAMFHIGQMYENGYGVKASLDLAIYWYEKGADRGCKAAEKALERLKN